MNKTHLLPTFVIALIGIAGVLLIPQRPATPGASA